MKRFYLIRNYVNMLLPTTDYMPSKIIIIIITLLSTSIVLHLSVLVHLFTLNENNNKKKIIIIIIIIIKLVGDYYNDIMFI